MVGNTVIWKPSNNAVYSNYIVMKILEKQACRRGNNFVPAGGQMSTGFLIQHEDLAGVHLPVRQQSLRHLVDHQQHPQIQIFPADSGETGAKTAARPQFL